MKGRLHVISGLLFVLVLLFDLAVWGGVKDIPHVGPKITETARTQAPLAFTYIALGELLDASAPALGRFGTDYATQAFEPGFERIKEDPNMAITALFERIWNRELAVVRFAYWAAPVLLALFLLAWWMRPRKVSLMRGRR